VLEPLGYAIVQAESGEEALKQVATHDFVLIIMDVLMPGLDGYQTTALIRAYDRSRGVPVIFLTAIYGEPLHARRGYALGAVDYISKPFDPEVLRAKVRALAELYLRGRRAERERNRQTERLKDLFLGAVGHDLRNPLNAILMTAQAMLKTGHELETTQRAHAKRIERSALRMQRMIGHILDLTSAQFDGRTRLAPKAADLGALSGAVVEEARDAHPERTVLLEVRGDASGHWDPGRLSRVVSNLVENALAHCEVDPVRVSVVADGPEVVLEVHNLGDPIDAELLPIIFEPFRRGDARVSGLGLGLYIVREIVLAHDGSVSLQSSAAEGTRFTVRLPRGEGERAAGDTGAREEALEALEPREARR
jgi:signal transduction histidine kinase